MQILWCYTSPKIMPSIWQNVHHFRTMCRSSDRAYTSIRSRAVNMIQRNNYMDNEWSGSLKEDTGEIDFQAIQF